MEKKVDKRIKNRNYYIQGSDFQNEYKLSQQQGEPTKRLISMFELIARRYSSKYNNLCQMDTESCINYAVMEAYSKWDKYDKNRSENIFAFFTQMIKNDLTAHYNELNGDNYRHVSIDAIFINRDH